MARKLALVVVAVVGLVVALSLLRSETVEHASSAPTGAAPVATTAAEVAEARAALEVAAEQRSSAADATVAPAPALPGPASLVVRVRAKEDGHALASIRVHLFDADVKTGRVDSRDAARGELGQELATDSEGAVEFTLPSGVATKLQVRAERGDTASDFRELEAFAPGERRELDVVLATPDDARFCVRVLERASRKPLAGVAVLAGGAREPRASTDADGRCELPFATWKPLRLRFELAGYAEARVFARPSHDTPETALEVLLERSATLNVQLDGAHEGSWDEHRVSAKTEAYRLTQHDDFSHFESADVHWSAKFDAVGRATLADLAPGVPLEIDVHRARSRVRTLPEPIVLQPGEERTIAISVATGSRIAGRAVDARRAPVAGVELWLLRGSSSNVVVALHEKNDAVGTARSADDGRFAFENVAAGAWKIGPAVLWRDPKLEPLADAVAPVGMLVEVPEGGGDREVELVVHRGLYVRGVVQTPDGAPAKRAHVMGECEGHWAATDARDDGTFVLGPLVDDAYVLGAQHHFERDCAPSEPVTAAPGTNGVVLKLRRGASVAGRVVDATSGEGVRAELLYERGEGAERGWAATGTRPDGSFEIGGLLPCELVIVASTSDGRIGASSAITLAAGDALKDVVVSLERGAQVTVAFEGTSSFGNARFTKGDRLVVTDGVERGAKHTFTVPAGSVRLEFRIFEKQKLLVRDLDLAPGEVREVVLREDE